MSDTLSYPHGPAVRLRSLGKAFGEARVLRSIDLDVPKGSLTVIVGPSGCGKSTLLRIIAGLEKATEGDLLIGGRQVNDLTPSQRRIAMVFQSYALYPHMTVYDNIAFGLKFDRRRRAEARQRVENAVRALDLDGLLDKHPRHLSGGQRQRVAIGRAIVREPEVFLFDEPLSNLDAALRTGTRVEIMKLHQRLAATMIYVTHDQVEAMTLATQVVVMKQGRIEQVGSPRELYLTPVNRFVAGFIGSPSMNFLDAEAVKVGADEVELSFPGGRARLPGRYDLAIGASITLGVRPEHLEESVVENDLSLTAQVSFAEWLGEANLVYLTAPGDRMVTMRASAERSFARGQSASITAHARHVHVFGQDGQRINAARYPESSQELVTADWTKLGRAAP